MFLNYCTKNVYNNKIKIPYCRHQQNGIFILFKQSNLYKYFVQVAFLSNSFDNTIFINILPLTSIYNNMRS